MDNIGGGLGIFGGIVSLFLLIAGIMAIFIPFWVLRIKNEIIRLNNEIMAVNDHLELLVKAAYDGRVPDGGPKRTDVRTCSSCGRNLTDWFEKTCPDCGELVYAGF